MRLRTTIFTQNCSFHIFPHIQLQTWKKESSHAEDYVLMDWNELRRDGIHITIDKKHQPLIQNDKVLEAELVEENKKLYLTRAEQLNDNKLLVRINTKSIFRPNLPGSWEKPTLRPRLIAEGSKTETLVGGILVSSWKDGLFIFSPGDHVLVRPEGWRDPVLIAYPHGEDIVVVTPEQGKRLLKEQRIKPIPMLGKKLLPLSPTTRAC